MNQHSDSRGPTIGRTRRGDRWTYTIPLDVTEATVDELLRLMPVQSVPVVLMVDGNMATVGNTESNGSVDLRKIVHEASVRGRRELGILLRQSAGRDNMDVGPSVRELAQIEALIRR